MDLTNTRNKSFWVVPQSQKFDNNYGLSLGPLCSALINLLTSS